MMQNERQRKPNPWTEVDRTNMEPFAGNARTRSKCLHMFSFVCHVMQGQLPVLGQNNPNSGHAVAKKKLALSSERLATLLYAFVFCIWSMSSYASQLTLFIPFLTGHQVVGLMTNMKHRSLILGERLHWFVAKQLAVSTNGGWHVKLSSHETSCECLSSQRHEHVVKEGQLDDLENHLRQCPAPSMFKTWPKHAETDQQNPEILSLWPRSIAVSYWWPCFPAAWVLHAGTSWIINTSNMGKPSTEPSLINPKHSPLYCIRQQNPSGKYEHCPRR